MNDEEILRSMVQEYTDGYKDWRIKHGKTSPTEAFEAELFDKNIRNAANQYFARVKQGAYPFSKYTFDAYMEGFIDGVVCGQIQTAEAFSKEAGSAVRDIHGT